MTTLDGVTKKAEPTAEQAAALDLVHMAQEPGPVADPAGRALLRQLAKRVLETSSNEEFSE
jgi:hypothetical protein